MSSNIANIEGRIELPTFGTPTYASSQMLVTRFSGGLNNGAMLQLSFTTKDYIQLNKVQIQQLKEVLANWEDLPEID